MSDVEPLPKPSARASGHTVCRSRRRLAAAAASDRACRAGLSRRNLMKAEAGKAARPCLREFLSAPLVCAPVSLKPSRARNDFISRLSPPHGKRTRLCLEIFPARLNLNLQFTNSSSASRRRAISTSVNSREVNHVDGIRACGHRSGVSAERRNSLIEFIPFWKVLTRSAEAQLRIFPASARSTAQPALRQAFRERIHRRDAVDVDETPPRASMTSVSG